MGFFSKKRPEANAIRVPLRDRPAWIRDLLPQAPNAPRIYSAQTVIMGGDCTGKMLIPIIADGNGGWRSTWAGEEAHLAD